MKESNPKQVENTVGKGEIARYEQFLLFPQCFQKACFAGASKGVIVWEWVKLAVKIMGIALRLARQCQDNGLVKYRLRIVLETSICELSTLNNCNTVDTA